jgi:hypothetical protein
MIRTQVYLTEEQAQKIKLRSQQEKKPEAQLIRELLENGLRADQAGGKRQTAGEALLELVALGKQHKISGPTDLSTNHDDYLYGDKE